MKVIGVFSSKGGVGKTLISINLAQRLSKYGNTGLIDADMDNSNFAQFTKFTQPVEVMYDKTLKLPIWNNVKVYSNSLLLGRERGVSMTGDRYAQMISDIMEYGDWGNLDYLVIDLPPGSSDIWKSVLSIFANVLLGDVIVVQPSMTDSAIRGIRLHKYYDIPVIGIVENMAYFKCRHDEIYYLFGKSSGEKLAEQFNVPYLGAIPIIPDMNEKIANGEVFIESEVLDNLAEKITTLEIPKTSFLERLKESVLKTIKEQIEKVIAFIIVKTQKEIDAKGVASRYGFTEQRPFALTITDESKQKIISRLFLKVKDGKLVVLSKPQTVDFEIVASFKTLARMIMGKAKVNGNIVPFDPFDAWACGDVVVYGTGFMPRAVSVLKYVFSDEQFLSEVRSKYGNILEQFI